MSADFKLHPRHDSESYYDKRVISHSCLHISSERVVQKRLPNLDRDSTAVTDKKYLRPTDWLWRVIPHIFKNLVTLRTVAELHELPGRNHRSSVPSKRHCTCTFYHLCLIYAHDAFSAQVSAPLVKCAATDGYVSMSVASTSTGLRVSSTIELIVRVRMRTPALGSS